MDLAVIDLIAIIVTLAGLVTSTSVLYAKFVKPIKNIARQVEKNSESIKAIEDKLAKMNTDKATDENFTLEVRAVLFQSLLAIHEGLEQLGCNHGVTDNKKKLVKFMSSQVGGKKKPE